MGTGTWACVVSCNVIDERLSKGNLTGYSELVPALDYISIRGFRSIASVEKLALRPLNILIGSNGSGKSNFIGVFAFLHAVRECELKAIKIS